MSPLLSVLNVSSDICTSIIYTLGKFNTEEMGRFRKTHQYLEILSSLVTGALP